MLKLFIDKLNEVNLCAWYILPWLDLNPASFEKANFLNAYLVTGKQQIAVHVIDSNLCGKVYNSPYFECMIQKDDKELLVFTIPPAWSGDYQKFLQGRYSKFSPYAKQRIKEGSGLLYRKVHKGVTRTDALLMALDRNRTLIHTWMDALNLNEEPDELLSIPSEDSFITLG